MSYDDPLKEVKVRCRSIFTDTILPEIVSTAFLAKIIDRPGRWEAD